MSEVSPPRHGLEAFMGKAPGNPGGDNTVSLTVRGDLGHINLRGAATDPDFLEAVENVLEQALPVAPNTMSQGEHCVFWLGPDEWLVLTTVQAAVDVAQRLQQATTQMHAAANDLSGGQVALWLEGEAARDLLAKGCTLDLHPQVFKPGDCAQSGLAKANVLLGLTADAPTFIIVVRRSFADYLCRWLARAGQEFGIVFTAS